MSNIEALKLLRAPFPANQISKLPKGTKAQNECAANDKTNCKVCGGWHHPRIIHLDYVGHAALTDRLLDVDPEWNWEPVAIDANGSPLLDRDGGMWIRLTVCGITRLGYGDAQGKTGGNAVKERIGDALRNAAMRFGAALDLWHKGELHTDTPAPKAEPKPLEFCDAVTFSQNITAWAELIQSKKKTAAQIIASAQKHYIFSAFQIDNLKSWEVERFEDKATTTTGEQK